MQKRLLILNALAACLFKEKSVLSPQPPVPSAKLLPVSPTRGRIDGHDLANRCVPGSRRVPPMHPAAPRQKRKGTREAQQGANHFELAQWPSFRASSLYGGGSERPSRALGLAPARRLETDLRRAPRPIESKRRRGRMPRRWLKHAERPRPRLFHIGMPITEVITAQPAAAHDHEQQQHGPMTASPMRAPPRPTLIKSPAHARNSLISSNSSAACQARAGNVLPTATGLSLSAGKLGAPFGACICITANCAAAVPGQRTAGPCRERPVSVRGCSRGAVDQQQCGTHLEQQRPGTIIHAIQPSQTDHLASPSTESRGHQPEALAGHAASAGSGLDFGEVRGLKPRAAPRLRNSCAIRWFDSAAPLIDSLCSLQNHFIEIHPIRQGPRQLLERLGHWPSDNLQTLNRPHARQQRRTLLVELAERANPLFQQRECFGANARCAPTCRAISAMMRESAAAKRRRARPIKQPRPAREKALAPDPARKKFRARATELIRAHQAKLLKARPQAGYQRRPALRGSAPRRRPAAHGHGAQRVGNPVSRSPGAVPAADRKPGRAATPPTS
ncbi:hypothetical protein FQR65_LT20314 [Abscondita terminalis]|nr:hypothetical protein FQR65_LT20314 [Abscondita terminalis]